MPDGVAGTGDGHFSLDGIHVDDSALVFEHASGAKMIPVGYRVPNALHAEEGRGVGVHELVANVDGPSPQLVVVPGVNAAGRSAMGDLAGYLLGE